MDPCAGVAGTFAFRADAARVCALAPVSGCREALRRLVRRSVATLGRACVVRLDAMMFIVSFPAQVKVGFGAIDTINANATWAHSGACCYADGTAV